MSHADVDHAAADAVVAHHAQLAADLTRLVALLRAAVRTGANREAGTQQELQWAPVRTALVNWIHRELLPHAAAEEAVLYAAAAANERGRLLIDGMIAEHRGIVRLASELETAGTAVDAAGAARALLALFDVHLEKENTLILPLLLASDEVSLAALLDGMHEVLGAEGEPVHEHGCGGHGEGGCACGGHGGEAGCACGGHGAEAVPQLLTVGTAR